MSTVMQIAIECFGQNSEALDPIPAGSSVAWTANLLDPETRAAFDCTGLTFAVNVSAFDMFDQPVEPPIITSAPTAQGDPTLGVVAWAWTSQNTQQTPAKYCIDLWAMGSGNALRLFFGTFLIVPSPLVVYTP